MKQLSIKLRVTLWYMLLMLLLIALVLGFMLAISGSVAERNAKEQLMKLVEDNAGEVEYDDGKLDIDDDFTAFSNGAYCALYSAESVLLYGSMPAGFDAGAAFENGTLRTVEAGGASFYVHDRLLQQQGYGDIWVRGAMPADSDSGAVSAVIRIAFITLPLFALLAAAGGYWIARRSFQPIEQIRATAEEIGEDGDLSRRIGLGYGRDELHKLANTFDEMFERLEASFEAEKQFTADASHELRTPTTVILAQCEYALAHVNTEQEYQEALAVIQRQAGRMSRLISQLLSFSRMERGIEQGHFEQADVSGLVQLICEEQQAEGSKDIQMATFIQPELYAQVDVTMFTRLLTNLISNAYRYGRQNGSIAVSLRQEGREIALSVEDDGIGIPPEQQEKVWQRFYQVEASRSAAAGGSMGLGLAMVKQIAKLHGGRMALESAPGRGSKFTFYLPINL